MNKKIFTLILMLALLCTSIISFAEDSNGQVIIETPAIDASQKPVYQDPTQTKTASSAVMQDTSQQQLLQTINGLSSYYANYLKNSGADWVANTDFSLAFSNLQLWNNPQLQISTLQPFKSKFTFDDNSLPFWQLSAGYVNGNITGNIGLGYRRMSASKTQMFGANLFYDAGMYNNTFTSPAGMYNFKATDAAPVHQRVGVGLEYFLYMLEARVNGYYALSNSQLLGTAWNGPTTTPNANINQYNYYEKAANGYDVSLSAQVPFIPWLKANVAGYQYFADAGQTAYNGSLTGLYVGGTVQLTPRLAIDGGYDNGGVGSGFVKATYNLLALPKPSLLWADETINDYSKYNVSNKLVNKVQRNNNITTVTYSQNTGTSKNGGVITVSVMDYQGNPQANVPVTVANSNFSVAIVDQTGANGTAVFTGLPMASNPNPTDLNAAFVNAALSVEGDPTPHSFAYFVVTNIKQFNFTAGGNWQDIEIVNTVSLDGAKMTGEVALTSQPQPAKNSSGTPPAPNPSQSTPPATSIEVTVVGADGITPYTNFADAGIQRGVFNVTGGNGMAINTPIVRIAPNKFSFVIADGTLDGINYGSGQYGVAITPSGTNTAIGKTQAVNLTGGAIPMKITIMGGTDEIKSLTVNYTDKTGKATNKYVVSPTEQYDVWVAAATSVNLNQPETSPHQLLNDSGTAVWSKSNGNALAWSSDQLIVVAYYLKNGKYYPIAGDPTINIVDPNQAYTSNIRQFPFSFN